MTETEYDLTREYAVTFTAAGTAVINNIGPERYGERWEIESIHTEVTGSVLESRLRIMQDSRQRVTQGTYSGNFDTSDTKISLQSGRQLFFAYENGTPGAIGRITITGRRFVRGRRGY